MHADIARLMLYLYYSCDIYMLAEHDHVYSLVATYMYYCLFFLSIFFYAVTYYSLRFLPAMYVLEFRIFIN